MIRLIFSLAAITMIPKAIDTFWGIVAAIPQVFVR